MAELSPIEKLKIIEDEFQKWFRKAYELKDYTDVDVDFLVRDLPGAKSSSSFQRYRYYDTQFKSTIKVPPQYQDNPRSFINALGKYFVDSAKFLYKDQIRYGYMGFESNAPGNWCWIDIYKACGNEVGCFCLHFKLEGNLVVVEVGYQIFHQLIPLSSDPNILSSFNFKSLAMSGRGRIFRYAPKSILNILSRIESIGFLFSWFVGFVLTVRWFLYLGDKSINFADISDILDFAWVAFLSAVIGVFFALPFDWICKMTKMCIGVFFDDPETRMLQQKTAIDQDLSPIHFPVKYFNHYDFNEAYTKSHDHQIFFKQLQEVVNRMSALGESSNS